MPDYSQRAAPRTRPDRPETANRLAGRSPPSKADRKRGQGLSSVSPERATGRGPTVSDVDYRTRSWLRLGPPATASGYKTCPRAAPLPQTAGIRAFEVNTFKRDFCFAYGNTSCSLQNRIQREILR